jgi:hypothetical protein
MKIMAGYDWDAGKSNNAVAAEEAGLVTASVLAKRLGVDAKAIKDNLRYAEWHHSSAMYNKVEYYDPEAVTADQIAAMKAQSAERKNAKKAKEFTVYNCRLEWTAWSGTRRKRSYLECVSGAATFSPDGKWCTIGDVRKSLDGNWINDLTVPEWVKAIIGPISSPLAIGQAMASASREGRLVPPAEVQTAIDAQIAAAAKRAEEKKVEQARLKAEREAAAAAWEADRPRREAEEARLKAEREAAAAAWEADRPRREAEESRLKAEREAAAAEKFNGIHSALELVAPGMYEIYSVFEHGPALKAFDAKVAAWSPDRWAEVISRTSKTGRSNGRKLLRSEAQTELNIRLPVTPEHAGIIVASSRENTAMAAE